MHKHGIGAINRGYIILRVESALPRSFILYALLPLYASSARRTRDYSASKQVRPFLNRLQPSLGLKASLKKRGHPSLNDIGIGEPPSPRVAEVRSPAEERVRVLGSLLLSRRSLATSSWGPLKFHFWSSRHFLFFVGPAPTSPGIPSQFERKERVARKRKSNSTS